MARIVAQQRNMVTWRKRGHRECALKVNIRLTLVDNEILTDPDQRDGRKPVRITKEIQNQSSTWDWHSTSLTKHKMARKPICTCIVIAVHSGFCRGLFKWHFRFITKGHKRWDQIQASLKRTVCSEGVAQGFVVNPRPLITIGSHKNEKITTENKTGNLGPYSVVVQMWHSKRDISRVYNTLMLFLVGYLSLCGQMKRKTCFLRLISGFQRILIYIQDCDSPVIE